MGRREREKKARQKAAREAQGEAATAGEPGGTPAPDPVERLTERAEQVLIDKAGGHWASRPGGKGEAENARLVGRSLRWNTRADSKAFTGPEAPAAEDLSTREIAILVTRRGMLQNQDQAAVARHVANLVRMEGQNQRDELEENAPVDADPAGKLAVVIREMRVVLEQTANTPDLLDDFYATETVAADHPATPLALARVDGPDAPAGVVANGAASRPR